MPTNVNLQKIIINSIPTKEIYNQMKAQGLLEPNQLYLVEEDSSVADMTKAVYDANGVVQNAGGIAEYVAANGGKIDVIKRNGTALPIADKAVDISVPTKLSELSADSTHRVVTDTEKSTWNGKGTYSKPSGGIPKSDLDSSVQGSLSKADSALQSFTETDPVFKASPAYGISSNDIENWDNKQSPISDLGTIRNNAAAGAAKVSCTDDTVGSFGYTKNTGDMEETVYDPDGLVAAAGGIPEYVEQNTPDPDSILDQNTGTPTKVWRGTKAQYDALDSYQNDVIYHVIGDEDASVEAIQSFNGRTGDVVPRSGDYTADQVGAIPSSEKGSPNGVPSLDARGKIPLAQIPTEGYVPTTRKINGNALTDDVALSLSDFDEDSSHRFVTDAEKSAWNAKGNYSKPSDGIPKSDLASNVQTSLEKADTALQSIPGRLGNTVTAASVSSCNNALESGFYYVQVNDPNRPNGIEGGTSSTDYHLIAIMYSSAWGSQIAQGFRSNGQWHRNLNNGVWSPWVREYDSSRIHLSTSQPTSSDGLDGDLWIVYEP